MLQPAHAGRSSGGHRARRLSDRGRRRPRRDGRRLRRPPSPSRPPGRAEGPGPGPRRGRRSSGSASCAGVASRRRTRAPEHRHGLRRRRGRRSALRVHAVRRRDGPGTVARDRRIASPEVAITIVSQSAAALDAAHAHGLVHGGVSSRRTSCSNAGGGTAGRAFLSDFGITRHVAATTRLTRTGSFAGTVDYVAPEVIRGESDVDGRADVYSLGCVLYQCVIGEVPFPRESELVTIFAHLDDAPPRPSDVRPDLPSAIDAVIERALAKSREGRFETCGELAVAASIASAPRPRRSAPRMAVSEGATVTRAPAVGGRSATSGSVAAPLLVIGGTMLGDSSPDRRPTPTPPPRPSSPVPPAGRRHRRRRRDRVRLRRSRRPRPLPVRRHRRLLRRGDAHRGTRARGQSVRDGHVQRVLLVLRPVVGEGPIDHATRPGRPRVRTGNVVACPGVLRVLRRTRDGAGRVRLLELQPPGRLHADDHVCWHFVALNSELCMTSGGCGPVADGTSPAPATRCTMAATRPRDTSERPEVRMHAGLLASSAVLVLAGDRPIAGGPAPVGVALHSARGRRAQRRMRTTTSDGIRWTARADRSEPRDPRVRRRDGWRQEGRPHVGHDAWPTGLATAQDTTFGVLLITLGEAGFTWQWVSAEGQPAFTDTANRNRGLCMTDPRPGGTRSRVIGWRR